MLQKHDVAELVPYRTIGNLEGGHTQSVAVGALGVSQNGIYRLWNWCLEAGYIVDTRLYANNIK